MERSKFIEQYMNRIDKESFQDILGEIYDSYLDFDPNFKPKNQDQKIESIFNSILQIYNLPYCKLILRTRKRETVEARQIAAYLIKDNSKLSLSAIGELLGGRDHATILYSIKIVKDLLETDKEFNQRYQQIINKL